MSTIPTNHNQHMLEMYSIFTFQLFPNKRSNHPTKITSCIKAVQDIPKKLNPL